MFASSYILYVLYNFIYLHVLIFFVHLSSQYGPFLKYYNYIFFYNLVYNFIMYTRSVYAGNKIILSYLILSYLIMGKTSLAFKSPALKICSWSTLIKNCLTL